MGITDDQVCIEFSSPAYKYIRHVLGHKGLLNQLLLSPQNKNTGRNITSTDIMGLSQSKPFNKSTRSLLKLTQERRTHYKLLGKSPISDNEIETLVQNATKYVPTAWNTQSSRVVLLLNDEHKKVWDIALSVIEGLVKAGGVPKDMFENYTKPKLEGFKAAYGTVNNPP